MAADPESKLDEITRLLKLVADSDAGPSLIGQLNQNEKLALGSIACKNQLNVESPSEPGEKLLSLIDTLKGFPIEM